MDKKAKRGSNNINKAVIIMVDFQSFSITQL